jgi:hypothetical protein
MDNKIQVEIIRKNIEEWKKDSQQPKL